MKIEIREVKSRHEKKLFVTFPLKLFKGNKYFVPPLYGEEMAFVSHKTAYESVADSIFFLAFDGKKVVGRIAGIIQKQYNSINNQSRVRFDRFDAINNQDVANALLEAVEKWGKENKMDTICGPLGFSDMEREGLLIEGFDQVQTFEEQYHMPYYQTLISNYGFEKDVDWNEYVLRKPKVPTADRMMKLAQKAFDMGGFYVKEKPKSKAKFINEIKDDWFELIDSCYKELYGVVPFTEDTKKQMIAEFKLLIDSKWITPIYKDNKMVAACFAIPGIGPALQRSGGRLTPLAVHKLFRLAKKPRFVDLGLVGILKEYRCSGIMAYYLAMCLKMLENDEIEYFNTNLNLETNEAIQSMWKYFDATLNKKRRAYIKKIK